MVNERIQYNICTAAQIITLLSDSGKRRGKGCGKLDIVKAYHTYIIWHIEAVQLALGDITPFAIVSLPQRIAVAPAAIKFET